MSALRLFASSLGLSITTVSRALDGYPDVSPTTRERVRKAAAEVGYHPHSAARRLRKRSGETVAFVMPSEPGRFYEPVFVELLSAIGERMAAQNYDLVLLAARPGPEEMAVYRRLVEGRRADAFIVVRTRRVDERVIYLQSQGIPFVCHGRTEVATPYAFVDGDGETGFREATERLIALGHRRIALLSAPAELMFSSIRSAGWRQAMTAAGLADDLMAHGEPTEDGGYALAKEILVRTEQPTALVCATDRMAIGAMRAVSERGLKVGSDIAVTGHDNIPASAHTDPALTTMELPLREVGERVADIVLARLGGTDPRDLAEIHPLVQIPRGSSGEGS